MLAMFRRVAAATLRCFLTRLALMLRCCRDADTLSAAIVCQRRAHAAAGHTLILRYCCFFALHGDADAAAIDTLRAMFIITLDEGAPLMRERAPIIIDCHFSADIFATPSQHRSPMLP